MNITPIHNLYWRKYLTYGYHELISMYMDDNGVDIYSDIVTIIEQAKLLKKDGATLLKLGKDKVCYVYSDEFDSVLDECLKFFLEKEEYMECARIRDILNGQLIIGKLKKESVKKTLI